ncbi:helix-turn-helix transcriptional regulator [Bacillus subtilis]|uniref:helix-turn-helix transcriptional regulator n=1 Tax=Bacillus subtilis TaxID=1423 RepID=UPI0020268432|nr:helix-turn-helix domain-containing protein [Bacillus subtilis]
MGDEMSEKIGKLIKEHRESQRMTSAELATLAGVSQGTISNIENGRFGARKGSIEKVRQIVTLLQMDISDDVAEYLFIDKDKFPPTKRVVYNDEMIFDVTNVTRALIEISTRKKVVSEDAYPHEKAHADEVYTFESDVVINTIMDYLKDNHKEIGQKILDNLRFKSSKLLEIYKKYDQKEKGVFNGEEEN